MNNKIKFYVENGDRIEEFDKKSPTLIMPNGTEFRLRWDEQSQGLEIIKVYGSDNSGSIEIHPKVSNHILIK